LGEKQPWVKLMWKGNADGELAYVDKKEKTMGEKNLGGRGQQSRGWKQWPQGKEVCKAKKKKTSVTRRKTSMRPGKGGVKRGGGKENKLY